MPLELYFSNAIEFILNKKAKKTKIKLTETLTTIQCKKEIKLIKIVT